MSTIDNDGMLIDTKVKLKRYKSIEHGTLPVIHAILVHQTDAPTAQHTFNGYNAGGNGAHFLISKAGEIYQTASLNMRCYHVGRLIKSKCLSLNKADCENPAMTKILTLSWGARIKSLDTHERAKQYPDRFPINSDSIGIELVGKHIDDQSYEAVTVQQNTSLQWLVGELHKHFSTTNSDVYRHPTVSYKNPGEASTAKWK
ncbi:MULTISPECIES: peptidoglycan recognition protein family protein [Thalassolituus]|uniref:peptidoglycan recognition protein family protein n=1 Tax=Thalassolituus TaxID=187492 RepID=UPI0030C87142